MTKAAAVSEHSIYVARMLTDYIQAAMREAHYELMENGRFFGSIPKCKGAWADGTTLEETRAELQSVLESWLLLGFKLAHKLPVIAGINLNLKLKPMREYAKAD